MVYRHEVRITELGQLCELRWKTYCNCKGTKMDESGAIIVGAVISGVIGTFTALVISWLRESARADVVRACMISEISLLMSGISPIINSQDISPGAAVAAMSTLGTLKTRVYQGLIPQLGVLGIELAGEIVGLYSNLELVIERGQEIEREGEKVLEMTYQADSAQKINRLNDEALGWIKQCSLT